MIPWFNIPSPGIGPFHIHSYGVLVAIGIMVGAYFTQRRGTELGLKVANVQSMITTTLVVGFLFAHFFDVIAYQVAEGHVTVWQVINPFSGLSSYGGFMGALAGLFYWCKKNKTDVMPYADSLAFGLAPGWMFGRFGCFSAHDHPGHITTFFLSVRYYNGPPRHDLGLDEALWALGITLIFLLLARRKRVVGLYVTILTLAYAPVRFFFDFLRATDLQGADARYYGLTPAQYGAILTLFAGIGLWVWTARNARKAPASAKAAAR